MRQASLWGDWPDVDASDTDSYCTPPEVMSCVHASTEGSGIALDPWSNGNAIAHGWVRARTTWTLADGRSPGPEDERPWPLRGGDYVHGNPPYSGPEQYVERFIAELARAHAWGGLLMKTDSRTQWWRKIANESPFVVMWAGPISFFLDGYRERGNNFASSILVLDYTDTPRTRRYDVLSRAYEDKAWVYR